MKQIILKVPTAVFVGLILAPILLLYFGYVDLTNKPAVIGLSAISAITYIMWGISLVTYMSEEAGNTRFLVPCIALFVIYTGFELIVLSGVFSITRISWALISSGINVLNAILMTILIKKVFYARSTWYLFLELLIFPVGMMSLTPEVKRWETGAKYEKEESDVIDD